MPPAEIATWRLEQLRLTIFSSSLPKEIATNWWAEVVGAPPGNISQRAPLGLQSWEGQLLTTYLTLMVGPGRIDWVVTPLPDEKNPFPDIGLFAEMEELFVKRMSDWLDRLSIPISRLAVGMVAKLQVKNKDDGYAKLADYLPALKIDIAGSSDLIYQINRPKSTNSIDGLHMNRLGKWGVISLNMQLLGAEAIETAYFCRTETDVNSIAKDNIKIDGRKSVALFREFLKVSNELVEKGDVA